MIPVTSKFQKLMDSGVIFNKPDFFHLLESTFSQKMVLEIANIFPCSSKYLNPYYSYLIDGQRKEIELYDLSQIQEIEQKAKHVINLIKKQLIKYVDIDFIYNKLK